VPIIREERNNEDQKALGGVGGARRKRGLERKKTRTTRQKGERGREPGVFQKMGMAGGGARRKRDK